MPPIAWSLPGFHSDAYSAAPRWLEALADLGFRWVTLHPTHSVSEDGTIGEAPDVLDAVRAARQLGLRVRLEPHLDYESTLSGSTYRWRRDMDVDPTGPYLTTVLRTAAMYMPDELTLGSELDLSANRYPDQWMQVADWLRGFGFSIGHKLNHDWIGEAATIEYLKLLDYVALSWYVPDLRPLPEGYVIGELGLGSTDVSRPWHFDASTFSTPEALAVRRTWYLERLDWLEQVRTPRAACFWTAGHFDILGVMHPEWRDGAVVERVREYNHASP